MRGNQGTNTNNLSVAARVREERKELFKQTVDLGDDYTVELEEIDASICWRLLLNNEFLQRDFCEISPVPTRFADPAAKAANRALRKARKSKGKHQQGKTLKSISSADAL